MLRRVASLLAVSAVLLINCSPSGVGLYVNEDDEDEYIELRSDGSFYLEESVLGAGPCMGMPGCSHLESFAGTYSLENDALVLAFSSGRAVRARLVGNTIIDDDGERWIKGRASKEVERIAGEDSDREKAYIAAAVPTGPIDMAAIEAARDWGGYVVGVADAPVEIIEYADFECPACRVQWVLTVQDVKQRLVATGRARYAFRDFPLNMHVNSRPAHHAAACADEQGMFEQMHDQLFGMQDKWTGRSDAETRFRRYAGDIGVELGQYDACMEEGRYRGRIQASIEGGTALGVTGTPAFIIGNRLYSRISYDEIKAIVDSLAPVGRQ